MGRADRRQRTMNVAAKRLKTRQRAYSWYAWSVPETLEQPGRFRKRNPFACSCKDHSGSCHAKKGRDTPRVERRVKKHLIQQEMYSLE